MSEFKSVDDFTYRTDMPASADAYDSIDAWTTTGQCLRVMDSGQCIQIDTRAAAIALRDWLTLAIGDGK